MIISDTLFILTNLAAPCADTYRLYRRGQHQNSDRPPRRRRACAPALRSQAPRGGRAQIGTRGARGRAHTSLHHHHAAVRSSLLPLRCSDKHKVNVIMREAGIVHNQNHTRLPGPSSLRPSHQSRMQGESRGSSEWQGYPNEIGAARHGAGGFLLCPPMRCAGGRARGGGQGSVHSPFTVQP